MSGLDSYDGLPHLFFPDDLHVVLSGAALDSLIAACQQARTTGHGIALGPTVDGEARAIVLTRLEPLPSVRSPLLADLKPIQRHNPLPSRQERRAPRLAGVDREYW